MVFLSFVHKTLLQQYYVELWRPGVLDGNIIKCNGAELWKSFMRSSLMWLFVNVFFMIIKRFCSCSFLLMILHFFKFCIASWLVFNTVLHFILWHCTGRPCGSTMASLRPILMGRNGGYFLNYIVYSKIIQVVLKLLYVL